MNKLTAKKLILSLCLFIGVAVIYAANVYADCKPTYGGGKTCTINKRFEIDKKVRKQGDDDWEDKVMDVEKDEIVEFRIRVKNESDDEAEDFDDMKMEDFLPDEMERVGGSGFTEYWDDFEPGDTKTFIIEAKVEDDEYDRDEDFEKCVVNKAEVSWDGNDESSDTATVCYGDEEVTELPKTGSNEEISLIGFGLIIAGFAIKFGTKFVA